MRCAHGRHEPGKTHCAKCLDDIKKNNLAPHSKGLCIDCGKPVAGKAWRCETCRIIELRTQNKSRSRLTAAGVCYFCGKPMNEFARLTGRSRCGRCADKAKEFWDNPKGDRT